MPTSQLGNAKALFEKIQASRCEIAPTPLDVHPHKEHNELSTAYDMSGRVNSMSRQPPSINARWTSLGLKALPSMDTM